MAMLNCVCSLGITLLLRYSLVSAILSNIVIVMLQRTQSAKVALPMKVGKVRCTHPTVQGWGDIPSRYYGAKNKLGTMLQRDNMIQVEL